MDGDSFTNIQHLQARSRRVFLLGVQVDLVSPDEVMAFTEAAIAAGRSAIVANHNLHSLHLIRRSDAMRRFYAMADLIEADSTPMIAWGRLMGLPIGREHRCTYLDWRDRFWSLVQQRGWRVFYLGGAPGVAASGAEAVRRRYPGIELSTRDGYFDASTDSADAGRTLEEIKSFAPDVLLVGMGMPRQEAWICANAHTLGACVTFSVGAAFDYEAGVQKAAPRWMGPLGVEWLYRFVSDPRRLFTRYFVEPWSLIGPAMADLRTRIAR